MKYIRKVYRTIGDFYNKIEMNFLVGTLIFTVLLITYQIIMRYVFNNSSFWSEELARYIFIWQIWMGASAGFKADKHIKIELVTSLLKGKAKISFSLLSNLIMLVFCVFLVVKGYEYLQLVAHLHMVTPAMRVPYVLVYIALPLSAAASGLRLVGAICNDVIALFTPKAGLPQPVKGGEA